MIKFLLSLLILMHTLGARQSVARQSVAQQDFFSASNQFFGQYVKDGKVDYATLKQNPQNLQALMKQVEAFNINAAPATTQKAFYLNAYNIAVIAQVVSHYPIEGPLAVKGFFDEYTQTIGGKKLTLNQLENDIIRPTFKDARIHFALVCAAESCPRISSEAFFPAKVEAQLEARTKLAMNDNTFIQLKDRAVQVSKIFEWYEKDFGGQGGIIPFINRFRKKVIPANYALGFYEYSWKLNAKP